MHLKLRRASNHGQQTDTDAPHRLIFPRHALDELTKGGDGAAASNRPLGDADLDSVRRRAGLMPGAGSVINRIESVLDQMQRQMDQLKDDVQNFKFPTPTGDDDGYRPTAA